ncbi:SLATT domain-containing protein [Rhodococcus pyridinivorans]|uniref:SLATT domain-containing protein n=1 Tax=Rhodococcus TaxID=1827 RepID=UPI001C30B721|nr:SLATT domain-containing protein [Rhodococcus sp. DMU2021]QXF82059.1 SLATT domain-containing protein [Rhodococcus pyridinivorans]
MEGTLLLLYKSRRRRNTTLRKPAISSEDSKLREQLKRIEDRTYKTYRARQSASTRLSQRARAWNWAVVSLSTATTVAAIGMLTKPDMYGPNSGTLMVCLSVLVLVATLSTTNMDYPGRSRDMFLNYRKIQRLSVEIEETRNNEGPLKSEWVKEISNRYQVILDETENHTEGDYLRHFSESLKKTDPYFSDSKSLHWKRRRKTSIDTAITLLPYGTLVLPISLLGPLVASLLE